MDALVPFLTPMNIACYLMATNLVACATFGIDKRRAEAGRWRIPEARLLGLALVGGSPGAYAGRRLFRHKTRKQPFCAQLHAIAALQIVALAALGGWVALG